MELIVQGYFYYTAMVSKVSIEGLLVLQNVKKKTSVWWWWELYNSDIHMLWNLGNSSLLENVNELRCPGDFPVYDHERLVM